MTRFSNPSPGLQAGEYSGSARMADGTRRQLKPDEAKALWEGAEASTAKRAADMPTEQDAINTMFQAWQRLKELGWSESEYCPKDGSSFDVIEPGSSGIFRCHYSGDWPTGSWWLEDDSDLWPSRPVLFRLDPEQEAAKKERMAAAAERFRKEWAEEDAKEADQGDAAVSAFPR